MEKIKNLSVRKTIVMYLAVCLVCSFFLSAVIVEIATRIQEQIWWSYVDQDAYIKEIEKEAKESCSTLRISWPPEEVMGKRDRFISEACDFFETYTVLVLSVTTSCAAVFLFYKHKLEKPITELNQASKRIAENDLDFCITYRNRDEMGRLCHEFERMREQLAQNNQELWRTIEEERTLRAAIAHDIRSPLSVLKGYQEMLMDYLPDGTLTIEKAMEMLTESRKQIERMDIFVKTMQKMSSLEQRVLLTDSITAEQIKTDIRAELDILEIDREKQVILDVQKTQEAFLFIFLRNLGVSYTCEIGIALEPQIALLTAIFCADTYVQEIVSKRSEIEILYPMKSRMVSIFRRIGVQVIYLLIVSAAGYGMFYVAQRPISLYTLQSRTESEIDQFLLYIAAIAVGLIFWGIFSLTLSCLFRNIWGGIVGCLI